MMTSVTSINDTKFKNGEWDHITLIQPVKWCGRQIYNIGNFKGTTGSNQCARIVVKISQVALAVILLLPCAVIAWVGLIFSCAFSKQPIAVVSPPTPVPNSIDQPAAESIRPGQYIFATVPRKPGPPISEDDLRQFHDNDLKLSSNVPGVDNEAVFVNKAKKFFDDPKVKGRQSPDTDYSVLGEHANDHTIIDALLQNSHGFNIGEFHDTTPAKCFLIQNMGYLKAQGVTTLFFEGPDFRYQDTIDAYLQGILDSKDTQVQRLLNFIERLDNAWRMPENVSFMSVVESAKKHGIRVVFIDYKLSPDWKTNRIIKMNYVAAKVMARELKKFGPKDKFVALMGMSHLCQVEGDPNLGLSELFQCPALGVMQNREDPKVRRVVYGNYPLVDVNFIGNRHITILNRA